MFFLLGLPGCSRAEEKTPPAPEIKAEDLAAAKVYIASWIAVKNARRVAGQTGVKITPKDEKPETFLEYQVLAEQEQKLDYAAKRLDEAAETFKAPPMPALVKALHVFVEEAAGQGGTWERSIEKNGSEEWFYTHDIVLKDGTKAVEHILTGLVPLGRGVWRVISPTDMRHQVYLDRVKMRKEKSEKFESPWKP